MATTERPRSTVGALSLDDGTALRIYRTMRTIRATENRIVRGLGAGEFRMTFYGVRGQEVIPAAMSAHLRPDDDMVTTYRGMHDCIAKGVPLDELMAEMCGKVTGTSKGKGGPMHLSDPHSGLMVTTGVVGGGLPIAVGLGLAAKLRGTDQVTVVNFGDGATSIGAAHEAANIAALWASCPSSSSARTTPTASTPHFADYTRTERLAERFAPYGMAADDGRRQQRARPCTRPPAEAIGASAVGRRPDLPRVHDLPARGATPSGPPPSTSTPASWPRPRANEPVGRYRRWLVEEPGRGRGHARPIDATGVAAEVDAAVDAAKASAPPPDERAPDRYLLDRAGACPNESPRQSRPGGAPSRHHVRGRQPGSSIGPWPKTRRSSSSARTSKTRSAGS